MPHHQKIMPLDMKTPLGLFRESFRELWTVLKNRRREHRVTRLLRKFKKIDDQLEDLGWWAVQGLNPTSPLEVEDCDPSQEDHG